MPLMEGLIVIRSQIHGYGVQAVKAFKKGDFLLHGDGVLFRENEDFDHEYALITPGYERDVQGNEGPSMYWDLVCQSRWINHSCDPNSEVDTEWLPARTTIRAWWTAVRDIEPGEEITSDYAFSGHLAVPCNCATARCRGLIVDEDEFQLVPDQFRHLIRQQAY